MMNKFKKLTHESKMPWGDYKHRELKYVPANYLLDLEKQVSSSAGSENKFINGLLVYIDKNRSELEKKAPRGHSLEPMNFKGKLNVVLDKMPIEFTSHDFGRVAERVGISNSGSAVKQKQYFLRLHCDQITQFKWRKKF